MRMTDTKCESCEYQGEHLMRKDVLPECPACGGLLRGIPSASPPAPLFLKASLRDGSGRFTDQKNWSKLNVSLANTKQGDYETRAKIKTEMNRTKGGRKQRLTLREKKHVS